jgi:hypothetical protein
MEERRARAGMVVSYISVLSKAKLEQTKLDKGQKESNNSKAKNSQSIKVNK